MRRHPREIYCSNAATDLQKHLIRWMESWDLSTVEELAILHHTLGGTIGRTLRDCVRREREENVQEEKPPENSGDGDDEGKNDGGGRHRG